MNSWSIEIKPRVEAHADCHVCGRHLEPIGVLWQGIHVCAQYKCTRCETEFLEDLPVGHATGGGFRVDSERGLIRGPRRSRGWFGEPLLRALREPDPSPVEVEVDVFKPASRVVILNCLDSIYGHCVLKLLNAARHLGDPDFGLVVLVPSALAWMVPEGVAERWRVDLPLRRMSGFFPSLDRRIARELERFSEVRLSRATSHPYDFRIEDFTRVPRHDLQAAHYRITFIWRGDRLWLRDSLAVKCLRRARQRWLLLALQRRKVAKLLRRVRQHLPEAELTVAGIGREGRFPPWIEDQRVDHAGEAETERTLCRVYAQSRVVVGVHGSNMLLPSAHAGMCVDLMPEDRWPNIAQDILFPADDFGADLRMSAYRFRFVPLATSPETLASIVAKMVAAFQHARVRFASEPRGAFEALD